MNIKSILLPLFALGLAAMASGQTAQTKIGIIQMQSALIGTKDGQKAAQDLQKKREPKTKELEGKQNEINQLKEQLSKGSNTMSEDARRKLMTDIDARTKSFQREVEDVQADWDAEQNKIIQEIGNRMMVVIDKYARDNGYAVIIDVSNQQTPVLYAATSVDITQDIVRLYDQAATATPMTSGGAGAAPGTPAAKPAGTPPAKKATPPAK